MRVRRACCPAPLGRFFGCADEPRDLQTTPMMTRGRWQAIAAGYRTAKSRFVCVLVCGFRERSDAPNDTGTRLDAAGGPMGDRDRRDREQYLHIDADRGFGFGPTGLRQTRRRRRSQHVPTRRRQLAPLRSTMQAPPARRMLAHKESAAWRVSAPTRTW